MYHDHLLVTQLRKWENCHKYMLRYLPEGQITITTQNFGTYIKTSIISWYTQVTWVFSIELYHGMYIYQDSKLLVPVVCFAKLVETSMPAIWTKQTLDFCQEQPRRNQMYQIQS